MLKQRIITALILIPITLLILYFLPPLPFMALTAIITLAGAWEWAGLMDLHDVLAKSLYLIVITIAGLLASYLFPALIVFMAASIWWIVAACLVMLYPRLRTWWGESVVLRGLMGIFVLVPCWETLNYLRNQPFGFYILLYLFVLIWGADTFAYFAGKKWGKTQLLPQVSPGKTAQGLLGAFSGCLVITIVALIICQMPLHLWLGAGVVSLVTVIFSVYGDLFESMLKRNAGVKDSGKLIPGHGGLLDRIDSLTAAAPIFAFGAWVLVWWSQ